MPSPAMPSALPFALSDRPPSGAAVASVLVPTGGPGPGALQAPVHAPALPAWQQLSDAAAALAAYLVAHSQAVLLSQATHYCIALTDGALQSMSARLADPQQPMSLLDKSLQLAAVAMMPASRTFCESLLQQLQVLAKALLESLHDAWYGEAAGHAALDAADALPALEPAQAVTGPACETASAASGCTADSPTPWPPTAVWDEPVAWYADPSGVCLVAGGESTAPAWIA